MSMETDTVEKTRRGFSPEITNAIRMAKMFAESYTEVFLMMGGSGKFTIAPSFYVVDTAQTRHRVSSLLDFTGGINGFVIINYPEAAAIDVVSVFMQGMGMSADDCPKSIGEEVVSTLGEIINQVLGKFRKNIKGHYGMYAESGTPITMLVNTMLKLSPVDSSHNLYVRGQISTPSSKAFYIEFCVQQGLIAKLK